MFAIAYDLNVTDAQQHHPRGHRQAYLDIASTLRKFGFERVQRSVFASKDDDLAILFRAVIALRALDWFRRSDEYSGIPCRARGGFHGHCEGRSSA